MVEHVGQSMKNLSLTMLFRFDWDMLPDCPLLVLDPT